MIIIRFVKCLLGLHKWGYSYSLLGKEYRTCQVCGNEQVKLGFVWLPKWMVE